MHDRSSKSLPPVPVVREGIVRELEPRSVARTPAGPGHTPDARDACLLGSRLPDISSRAWQPSRPNEAPIFEEELALAHIAIRVTVMPDATTTIASETEHGRLAQLCDRIDGDELSALADLCLRARIALAYVRRGYDLVGMDGVA